MLQDARFSSEDLLPIEKADSDEDVAKNSEIWITAPTASAKNVSLSPFPTMCAERPLGCHKVPLLVFFGIIRHKEDFGAVILDDGRYALTDSKTAVKVNLGPEKMFMDIAKGRNWSYKHHSVRFFSSSSENQKSSGYSVLAAVAEAYTKPDKAIDVVLPMAEEFVKMRESLMKEKNDAVTSLMKEKNDALTSLMKEKNDAVTSLMKEKSDALTILEKKLQNAETERNYREIDLLEVLGELSTRALLEKFEANFGPWHEDRTKKWNKAVVDDKFKLILEQKKINPEHAVQMGHSMYRLSSNQPHSAAFRTKLLRISTNQLLMKKDVFNKEQNQLFSAVCSYLSMYCEFVGDE
uniref:Uncharacterized protein n=1 Tax=Ditylenchus dipsaci TaxID=166011 RepID=A0A915CNA0_9BILA